MTFLTTHPFLVLSASGGTLGYFFMKMEGIKADQKNLALQTTKALIDLSSRMDRINDQMNTYHVQSTNQINSLHVQLNTTIHTEIKKLKEELKEQLKELNDEIKKLKK